MNYQEFCKQINFGDTTAFVYDQPSSRYQYSSGVIDDDIFANAPTDGYIIVGINDLPDVKEVIFDNFLIELKPASNIEDEGYNSVKQAIEDGTAKIGYWSEGDTTTYMLILP